MDSRYYGHETQVSGIEEHRLVGGKGDGMRLLLVRNGKGLDFTVSLDRCADISRVSFKGDNMGYFTVNGYVGPQYFDDKGSGWLKSFTAGFITTCGPDNVGGPTSENGVDYPMHGRFSSTPAEHILWDSDDEKLWIKAKIPNAVIFGEKVMLTRTITCYKKENIITITDNLKNFSDIESAAAILYHINLGYPLLSEKSELKVNSTEVTARTETAKAGLKEWNKIITPTEGFAEQCYFHTFPQNTAASASLYNPDINKGLSIEFDTSSLKYLTEWKMMGVKDYVLGLEPGNCTPSCRDVLREKGELVTLKSGEEVTYSVVFRFFEK